RMHAARNFSAGGAFAAGIGAGLRAIQRLCNRDRGRALPRTGGPLENQARRQRAAFDGSREQIEETAMAGDVTERHQSSALTLPRTAPGAQSFSCFSVWLCRVGSAAVQGGNRITEVGASSGRSGRRAFWVRGSDRPRA